MNYDVLKLENQLCFPLYACSKEIIRRYKPFLDDIDLTYTQYIAMMILWEEKKVNVKELGKRLYLCLHLLAAHHGIAVDFCVDIAGGSGKGQV